MDPRLAIGVCIAGVLFVAPLVYFGELGAWTFDEPVSNLHWDEGGLRPQQSGGGGTTGGSGGGDVGGGGSGGDTTAGSSGGGGSGGDVESTGGSGGSEGSAPGPEGAGATTGSGGSGFGALGSGPTSVLQGGSGEPQPSFAFAGFGAFAICFGAMFALWGNALLAFFSAWVHMMTLMAAALTWLAYALILVAVLYLWAVLGVAGGVLTAGVAGTLVYLHASGRLWSD